MPNSALRVRSSSWSSVRNDIESFWLPFTANRAFKARPRLIARAKNMHYYTSEDRAASMLPRVSGAATLGIVAIRSSPLSKRKRPNSISPLLSNSPIRSLLRRPRA